MCWLGFSVLRVVFGCCWLVCFRFSSDVVMGVFGVGRCCFCFCWGVWVWILCVVRCGIYLVLVRCLIIGVRWLLGIVWVWFGFVFLFFSNGMGVLFFWFWFWFLLVFIVSCFFIFSSFFICRCFLLVSMRIMILCCGFMIRVLCIIGLWVVVWVWGWWLWFWWELFIFISFGCVMRSMVVVRSCLSICCRVFI